MVSTFFFLFGAVALGFCALAYFEAALSESYEQREFEKSLAVVEPARPSHAAVDVSRLEIPRLGVAVMVHEGVGSGTLRMGAGHVPGTAAPGSPGNVVIAAHRDTFFRSLRTIRADDVILIDTLQGTHRYSVEWTRVVRPSEIAVLAPSAEPVLTLVTCYPFYYVGPAPKRFIVRAREVASP